MKFIKLLKIFLLLFGFAFTGTAFAQTGATDSIDYTAAIYNSIKNYHQYLSPETGLYNGREYVNYSSMIQGGHPFFEITEFSEGMVMYNGIVYEQVPMIYDLVTGEIIVTNTDRFYKTRLIGERISWFSLLNHKFIKLTADSNSIIRTGFYDLLYDGETCLLKKQNKKIQETVSNEGIRKDILETTDYFIKKNNVFYYANSKSALLNILKDRKKELDAFIKKNKLDTRKKKDESFTQVVAYYNKLNSGS